MVQCILISIWDLPHETVNVLNDVQISPGPMMFAFIAKYDPPPLQTYPQPRVDPGLPLPTPKPYPTPTLDSVKTTS